MPILTPLAAASLKAWGFLAAAGVGVAVDPYFNYTTLLLHGDGTNGAQNNTFLDSSTNNFTITRNGNTTQGTFSPFSQTGWSNYFDGTGDYLSIADNAAFDLGSGAFTLEAWINMADVTPSKAEWIISQWQSDTLNSWGFRVETNGTLNFYYSADGNNSATVGSASPGLVANTWHHIAVVRNSNTVTIYVDGVSKASGTVTATFLNSTASVMVGNQAATGLGQTFTGYISNARVVKGTAVYTSAFTPPTTPLTAITNTSLLTCQSNRFRDASTNNFAITVNGNTSVQAFSPFAPAAAYSAATVGGSGYFDGSGDYLETPSSSDLAFGTGDFCVEFFIYRTVAGQDGLYSNSASAGGGDAQFEIQVNASNKVILIGWTTTFMTSSASLSINEWNHVAVVRSGTSMAIFINGNREATATSANNFSSTNTFYIGAQRSSAGNPVTGYISGLRSVKGASVYDPAQTTVTVPTAPPTAISNTELLLNFTNAGIIDNTAKNNLETVGNAQISTSVKKYGTGSLAFDGTGDGLRQPTSQNLNWYFGSGDMTIECWAYFNSVSGYQTLVDFRGGSFGTSSFVLWVDAGTLSFFAGAYSGASPVLSGGAISTGQWYHIVVSRSSGTTKLFVNGTQTATTTNAWAQTFSSTDVLGLGGTTNLTGNFLNGYIDDLRITKGVARYTANFTPPTAAFADL